MMLKSSCVPLNDVYRAIPFAIIETKKCKYLASFPKIFPPTPLLAKRGCIFPPQHFKTSTRLFNLKLIGQ